MRQKKEGYKKKKKKKDATIFKSSIEKDRSQEGGGGGTGRGIDLTKSLCYTITQGPTEIAKWEKQVKPYGVGGVYLHNKKRESEV